MSDINEEQKRQYKRAEENDIKLLKEENNRLNNIIDEIKNMCKEEYYKKNTTDIDSIGLSNNIWVMIYMKINKLKGDNK